MVKQPAPIFKQEIVVFFSVIGLVESTREPRVLEKLINHRVTLACYEFQEAVQKCPLN